MQLAEGGDNEQPDEHEQAEAFGVGVVEQCRFSLRGDAVDPKHQAAHCERGQTRSSTTPPGRQQHGQREEQHKMRRGPDGAVEGDMYRQQKQRGEGTRCSNDPGSWRGYGLPVPVM